MRLPRVRFTTKGMIFAVAWLGVCFGGILACISIDPFTGLGTVYSERYSEARFNGLRPGMTAGDVEAIMGPPLKKVAWNSQEMWLYSNQPHSTANFWRRWVYLQDGRTTTIINDFWVD
jgi:hypothetical protein